MNVNGETKVKDIALSSPQARQILEEAGVDYCCGGAKSLHEACLHTDVSADEILKRLRENREQVSSADATWLSASLTDLTRYIHEKHHRYVREAIPRVQALLEKVKAQHEANHPEIGAIEKLFFAIAHELLMHMQKEEQILFPYINALEFSAHGNGSLEPPFFQTVRNPVQAMMKEHDAAGDLLRHLRTAAADYTAPADACATYLALYQGLREFEEDLHQHVHLENNILFPRAVDLEAAVVPQR